MSAQGTITVAWRGGEHQFCLAKVGLILDLEDKCKAGVAGIFNRLIGDAWFVNDVRETIRLALIGGGMKPDEAMQLVRNNVDQNESGLAPSVMLAVAILKAVIVGVPDDPVGKEQAVAGQEAAFSTTTDASAAPKS
jgi:hypothetical protein